VVFVLDACAIIAYIRNEPGADVIESILMSEDDDCLIHAINLCEVYYDFLRVAGERVAQDAIADLGPLALVTRQDMDVAFWQSAGQVKAHFRISLADCFAVALASRLRAEVLTSDHREFEPVAAKGICPVRFFR